MSNELINLLVPQCPNMENVDIHLLAQLIKGRKIPRTVTHTYLELYVSHCIVYYSISTKMKYMSVNKLGMYLGTMRHIKVIRKDDGGLFPKLCPTLVTP